MIDIIRLLLDKPWVAFLALAITLVLALIFEDLQYKHQIFRLLKKCFLVATVSFLFLGFFFLLFGSRQRPVSSNEWVEIYQNDLDATVKLEYQDYKDYYHSAFAGTHDERLKDLSDTVIRKQVIRGIKLTVKKDYNEIQKIVVLDKDNLIQKYDDLNNVKISKVEYRKIDGLSRVLFGVYGSPQKYDEIGEIRITLESSEDKELQKVFGQ